MTLIFSALAFVGSLHEGAGFVDGALGVVVGLDGEAVLVDGTVALAGDVEDAAELDVAPDLDPLGVVVAAQGVAEGVGGGLVVALHEEDFADAVGGERAVLVGVEGLLVLDRDAAVRSPWATCCWPRRTATRTARSGVLLSSQFSGSMVMRRGRPKVSTE